MARPCRGGGARDQQRRDCKLYQERFFAVGEMKGKLPPDGEDSAVMTWRRRLRVQRLVSPAARRIAQKIVAGTPVGPDDPRAAPCTLILEPHFASGTTPGLPPSGI